MSQDFLLNSELLIVFFLVLYRIFFMQPTIGFSFSSNLYRNLSFINTGVLLTFLYMTDTFGLDSADVPLVVSPVPISSGNGMHLLGFVCL